MIHWVDATFRMWGEWLQTGRGNGSRGLSANYEGVGGGGSAGAVIPVKDLNASRVDDWVHTRGQVEQALLLQVYCTPSTARESAALLKVSLRTMYARLHQVHVAYASRTGHAPVGPVNTRAAPPRPTAAARAEARALTVLRRQLQIRSKLARRRLLGPPTLGALKVREENRRIIKACLTMLRTARRPSS